ncbi:thioredoxin-dependent thiol peroxidase [Nonomuraea sp. PA05]|nr:thioredoxin-dependent thiol peroxidase [Nonomuraea sp. PA05]
MALLSTVRACPAPRAERAPSVLVVISLSGRRAVRHNGRAGRLAGRTQEGPLTETRLTPGDAAPEFTLPTADGGNVSLDTYRGKRVILYFYPAAMTPGCTKQACDFRDNLGRLTDEGFVVLGVSKDKPEKLAKFAERDALTFPLLSDPDLAVHQAYGAYGTKKLYGKEVVGVIRSTFVIDGDGKVEQALYNVKATGHVASLTKKLGLS